MTKSKTKPNLKKMEFRAGLPRLFRVAALAGMGLVLLLIGIGFYLNFGKEEFRMKGLAELKLSKDVIAEISGYERRETEGDRLKFLIRADHARTFSDNHQELDNVYLEIFDETGETSDKISANKAIYVPDEQDSKIFTAFFAGDVTINSRDGLNVKTDQLTYRKATEIAEAEEYIEFSRQNISGNSVGAIVNNLEKTLELLKDVEIFANASGSDDLAKSKIRRARITAGRAFFDQTGGSIRFDDNIFVEIIPQEDSAEMNQPAEIRARQATARFSGQQLDKIELSGDVFVHIKPTSANPKWTKTRANRAVAGIKDELKRLELFENVEIESTQNNSRPTRIRTEYALYEKDSDRFELKKGVEIVTIEDDQPTRITAAEAVYEQSGGKIFLTGNAEVTQKNDLIRGDSLTAFLLPNKKVLSAYVRGNAYLKQSTAERTTEVTADELNAVFDDGQDLKKAYTKGDSRAVLIPSRTDTYTRVTLETPTAIRLDFQKGMIAQMETEGRTTISLNSPNTTPDSSNKKLTADSVRTVFDANGRDLTGATANGNAELLIEPLNKTPENYKTTIFAPRFECDFYAGNNAKSCSAATNVKAVRVPTVASIGRGQQVLTAGRMVASFSARNNDVEKLEAQGNAKFSELDRNGQAEQIIFTQNDEIVRLRGGEPTVWDDRARAKATEIDWDTRNERSGLRGGVSTTYYNQIKTGGATPFSNSRAPVYITSAEADFEHRSEVAVYKGNARAWQENSYVRADKLVIRQKEGRLEGEGTVQSLLYQASRKENGRETKVPVYATGDTLLYVREKNYLRFEGSVDIRQGTDRILAGVADVYLNERNELNQTVVERNVVITQPNRKATGDYAKYNAQDESVVLRGSPASIEDREQGSSQSAQFTFMMSENRVISEGRTSENNTGRIRSVYKVKPKPE